MKGILKLAYKLLVNDKAKFTALLVGITFAVFLMIAMTSLFAGVLKRASATVINLGASDVDHGSGGTNGREHDRHAGLRVGCGAQHPGRELCRAGLFGRCAGEARRWRLPIRNGGRPGRYQPVRAARNYSREKSKTSTARMRSSSSKIPNSPSLETRALGTEFEVNDHRGVIVGIAQVASSGLVRRSDALHNLRTGAAIHPEPSFHHLLCSGRAQEPRGRAQHQARGAGRSVTWH